MFVVLSFGHAKREEDTEATRLFWVVGLDIREESVEYEASDHKQEAHYDPNVELGGFQQRPFDVKEQECKWQDSFDGHKSLEGRSILEENE